MTLAPLETASLLWGLVGMASAILVYRVGGRVRRSKKHLEWVFDHVDPMVVVDANLRILRANVPFADISGKPIHTLLDKPLSESVPVLDILSESLRAGILEGKEVPAAEIEWNDRVLEAQIFGLARSRGLRSEGILRLRDITALAHARKLLVDRNVALADLTDALQSELEMAREIQQALLPNEMPRVPGVEFHVRYLPSRPVGGDLYDLCLLDDSHLAIFMADVAGHGLPAAFEAALVRMSFLNHAQAGVDTAVIFGAMNRDLRRSLILGHYVTAFVGVLDLETLRLRFCRASHPRPVLLREGQPRRTLGGKGLFLGIVDEGGYVEEEIQLAPGDRLCMFTDGYYETANRAGHRLGYEAFVDRLPAALSICPLDELGRVELDYPGQEEGGREDDRTFLALDIRSLRDPVLPVLRRMPRKDPPEIRWFSTAHEGWELVERLRRNLSDLGWESRDIRRVQLVASELCVNAVLHGLKDRPQAKACCAWSASPKECLFSVHDGGPGFDPASLPDPRDPDRLGLDHGRGVFLVRRIAQEVQFDDGGSTATVRLESQPPAGA
ncbi:MAG TPA: SpoIIE family protein phosphatase [Fibrobacteria bacterium]|nr:SpoIIE family protein phosphatase [Fibrobacteria bacterium]